MDETILKCYLESVMKVQDKYGWIMDSYVLVSLPAQSYLTV